jgi:hypothetical protein
MPILVRSTHPTRPAVADPDLDLEQAQAAGEAMRQGLETEFARQQDEIGARNRALVQARTDFSGELDKLRSGAELAEERLRATEKRTCLRSSASGA